MTGPKDARGMARSRSSEGRPKLLFTVGDDEFFCSHRMPVARAARDAGFAVAVACPVATRGDTIRAEGMRVLPIPMKRGRISPLADLRTLAALRRLYRAERPDIVHHVAMKPVLYGAAAARLAGAPVAVAALTGLGYVFSSRDLRARLLRPLLSRGLRWALNGRRSTCLTQNPDDAAFVAGLGVDPRRIAVIPGSARLEAWQADGVVAGPPRRYPGVDTSRFAPSPEPDGPVRVTLVSRMLWDKGIGEFVEAARAARAHRPELRFTLIGAPDEGNPAAVPPARLEAWRAAGLVEWQGRRDDIPAVWRDSHIAVLPSYYAEGLPKTLIEAAACARPIVAADVPGSREVAREGESALLVPPRDPAALAAAIIRLAGDPALRARLEILTDTKAGGGSSSANSRHRRAEARRARILGGADCGCDACAVAPPARVGWGGQRELRLTGTAIHAAHALPIPQVSRQDSNISTGHRRC